MKKLTKISLMLTCMVFVIGIMIFGVYAASLQHAGLSASISFDAASVSLQGCGIVYGTTSATEPKWESSPGNSQAVTITEDATWTIGAISFKMETLESIPQITFCLAIRNAGVNAVTIRPNAACTSVSNTSITCKQRIIAGVANIGVTSITEVYHGSTLTTVTNTWSGSTYTGTMGATSLAQNSVYYFEISYIVSDPSNSVVATPITLGFDVLGE